MISYPANSSALGQLFSHEVDKTYYDLFQIGYCVACSYMLSFLNLLEVSHALVNVDSLTSNQT